MKRIISVFILAVLGSFLLPAQVVINEVQVTNDATLADEDGDFEDWFELYNNGAQSIDLEGYGLSDDVSDPMKWLLPSLQLAPGERRIVFASGKDRGEAGPSIDHFETPVYPWSMWSYIVPASEPDAGWRTSGFDASGWNTGAGGVGYGDADDGTDIGGPVVSVFSRYTFNLTDASTLLQAYFFMDYDDGFVAYLNGIEIARVNCGETGTTIPFDAFSTGDHEAAGYQDLPYDVFELSAEMVASILVTGENVLAIQVHNSNELSSDLSGNALLVLTSSSSVIQTELAPEWLGLQVPPAPQLHTNFKLSAGEILTLAMPDESGADVVELPAMQLGHAYQRSGDGNSSWCVTVQPSPDDANVLTCASGYAPTPVFSLESGVYTGTQLITITSPDPDADIRITWDGSVPDETSALYPGPFPLDQTAVISARCFSSSYLPGMVEKNTYMIDEWGIDIPVVSVTTNPDNLWDPITGIHVLGPDYDAGYPHFGANFWEDWEREAYMEYFDGNHVKQVEGPVGIKIHGGWSRGNTQKSFRIQCKDEYGMETMDYPFIADKPFITSYKGFNLRNGGNAYWEYRFHDALMQRAFRGTHADYMAYSPVVVFLNGAYWGFMEMREILDQNWVENNHGIDNDDATVVSLNYMGLNVINGDDASFYPMFEYIMNNDPNSEGFFETVSASLDMENYADYIIAETYWCNGDWSNGWVNNTKFWHDDTPGGKWRFMLMDMDFGMGLAGSSPNDDFINTAQDEGYVTDQMFSQIIQNDEFRAYFINRYADIINYYMQQDRIEDMAYTMRDEVVDIFPRHCQNWGTDCGTFDWTLEGRLNWNEERIQGARDVVQEHFNMLNQVQITLDVVPAGAGRIHISTIEPLENEYPWTGVYYNGVPVRITVVANPGYVFDHWDANGVFPVAVYLDQLIMNFETDEIFTAHFTGAPAENAILVSEFMYHPDEANDCGDWIELHNTLDVPLDLSGMYVKDSEYFNRFNLPLNATLAPGAYLVLAADTALFAQQYPATDPVLGPFDFSLSNATDMIRLYNFHDENVISFTYSDDSPWPASTDGTGRTNEFNMLALNQDLASNWFPGCIGGSPAMAYDEDCGEVSVDETLAKHDILLYPVPVSDVLNVSLRDGIKGNAFFEVVDAQGRVVMQNRLAASNFTIGTSELPSGIYQLRITLDGASLNKAFVVR